MMVPRVLSARPRSPLSQVVIPGADPRSWDPRLWSQYKSSLHRVLGPSGSNGAVGANDASGDPPCSQQRQVYKAREQPRAQAPGAMMPQAPPLQAMTLQPPPQALPQPFPPSPLQQPQVHAQVVVEQPQAQMMLQQLQGVSQQPFPPQPLRSLPNPFPSAINMPRQPQVVPQQPPAAQAPHGHSPCQCRRRRCLSPS